MDHFFFSTIERLNNDGIPIEVIDDLVSCTFALYEEQAKSYSTRQLERILKAWDELDKISEAAPVELSFYQSKFFQ